ncbi:MAG: sigma-E processing peptidase SpoIIGA, partial [Oscillospiraceae bacterium]|nr:sigma-E processing peptidase SpoIIGA [Oscillospiraceae bacterium]
MDVIYVDELIALNAMMDYLLLMLSARLAALPLRRGRCALAALLGGAYALGAAVWPLWQTGTAKLAASALLC